MAAGGATVIRLQPRVLEALEQRPPDLLTSSAPADITGGAAQ